MLVSPLVRLPASVFIVTHFDRMLTLDQQIHMLGYDHRLVVSVFVLLVTCCGTHFKHVIIFQFTCKVYTIAILCQLFKLLSFCLSPGEVSVSFSARFKCPGAEEHARNPALLFPFCYVPGRFTHKLTYFLFYWTSSLTLK